MPTPTKGPRLGGSSAHERHILANLATALFEHGKITTTEARARRLRPVAERLITFAKRGDLHARRKVLTVVSDRGVVHTLFTDIGPGDAPTRLVIGSHLYVPEFLAPYGEAGINADGQFWRPSVLCRPVAHATGQAGDAFLCHPFMVHTATWPRRGTGPRMIAQPAVHVRDGFALDGSDPSPVAKAIMAGLAMAGQN